MDKLKMHSLNLTDANIASLRELFPGCVTESRGEDGSVKLTVDFDQLRQELAKSEAVLDEHRSQEKNLRNTLLSAQKLADEIKENAQQEAGRILRDAEGRSDLLLQKSQHRVDEVQREIDGLRLKRKDVETSLESIISALYNTIEYVRDQDTKHKDEKILLHRPRGVDAVASSTSQALVALEEPLARTAP